MKTGEATGRAGLYRRLSKEDEKVGESMSIEHQGLLLRQYAAEHGLTVVDEYTDDGYSGTNFDRPDVRRLLQDAKTGRIDTIVVKDLSRFGRNYIEVGQYIDYIFPACGVRFIAISDNVDTADRTSAAMDMMPILNVFNEWHAANTSKKIRAVLQASRRAGKCTNWQYPYGYRAGTDENRTAVVDQTAAAVVRRIFDMRAQGVSIKKIAKTLTDEGIPNPATYYTRRDGKKIDKRFSPYWCAKTVMWILRNPVYIGTLIQHKTTGVSYKNHTVLTVPDDERIVKENAHEPIVSRELWQKVQTIQASASRGRADKNDVVHALSGLMTCADCGKKLKRRTGAKKAADSSLRKAGYACRTYTDLGKAYCTSHFISEKTAERLVCLDIRSLLADAPFEEEKAKERFLRARAKANAQKKRIDEKNIRSGKDRLAELDTLIRAAFEEKVAGTISADVCFALCERYGQERASLSEEIEKAERQPDEAVEDEADAEEYVRRVKRYASCEALTRELCLQLIARITVGERSENGENRTIHIYYNLKP